ncbi:unnamed protein product [Heterobilharzia americana]|nr:unnamed protein product [Heterobilharzia americana]
MKSSRVPNGSLDFSSSPYKTVKENSAYKNNKKHSTVGNTSINHHQRTTNETKRSISDKQRMLITDAKLPKNSSLSNITNDLSHNSNPSYTNQLPQKARRSLLDWDSFINLSKKPRNLSLKTDNSLRRLPSETIRPASLSPIKTKQESNHNWLSPLRTNASMKKTSVVSVKSNPESDKAHILCDNRSSFEEHAKNHTFKKEEESSSHVSTSACVSPPIVVKNPTESRKRRLSLLSSGCNSLEIPSSDDVDSDSRKQNHEKNHIHIHEAKKRKLSPLVPINKKKKKKRKKSSTLSVNSDQCNDLQSPGTHFDTDNAIQVKEVADQSMSEFSDLQADEISSHGKSEQSLLSVEKSERNENEVVVSKENDESQETFLSTRSPSTPAWLKAIHGPSLRERKSPESVKWTKEKLYKVSQMCESPPILHGISTNSGNTTVDEEISISNGVVCHVNENLQNGHSNVNEKSESTDRSLQFSYLNKEKKKKKKREKPKFIHTSDPELKLVTPPQSSPSLVDSSNCSLDASNTDNKLCDESFKPTESSLSSNNHSPKSIEKSIWQNYRPAYSGPYTCAFCDRVIHKGSNFARHIATCKARLSISTGDTPSAKSSGYEDKRKFHYSFKSFPKVTSKSGNLKRQLPRSQGLNSSVSKMDGNFHSPVFSDDKNIADTPTLKKTDDIETPS